MIVIGDVHGHFEQHALLCKRFPNDHTLQLGDMGIGFGDGRGPVLAEKDYFFRGNHDNPQQCRQYVNYLDGGGMAQLGETEFFYVPGAWSIDQWARKEGVSWWADEELSHAHLQKLTEYFARCKPDLVITHDAPDQAKEALLNRFRRDWEDPAKVVSTRTGRALTAMFGWHQPKHWIFGHYHADWQKEINGTLFQCLNELSWTEVA